MLGFDLLDFDEKDGVILVHPQLPMSTAHKLGVPTLMSRMLNAEEFSITSYGQREPLTNRLRKLLEDYSDGLAIPKEIIQNADDAGATEVRCDLFLFIMQFILVFCKTCKKLKPLHLKL